MRRICAKSSWAQRLHRIRIFAACRHLARALQPRRRRIHPPSLTAQIPLPPASAPPATHLDSCRTHSREAVLGAITNAISTGLLDVSQTGALSVVPQMIEWQFAGAKRARPQEAAYVPPPALYVPPSRPPPPPLDTTVPVPSALEEFEAAVEREEARAVASVAAASAALRATRAAAAAALASAQQPVAATTLDSSVTAGSASTGHLSRAAGAGVGAGSGARANAGANRSSAASAPADDSLTEEQTQVWRLVVVEGRSVFFTGSAGTGKSFLLRRIISDLKEKYREENRPDAVVVTAPTGIAACNIGGVTLHSFAGIGQGREPADKLCAMVNRSVRRRTTTAPPAAPRGVFRQEHG